MNTHLALYRKYRPETFDDVVGQDNVVRILSLAIKKDTISHAYLFCGGRGTGKTSLARIFARDIKCAPEDIIEIDAASNRGIDEIRDLKESVRTLPFRSRFKVYIIDEAHMLTKDAANAFLKTLEEPPKHIIFILATTDPDKLPKTILSRCQKIVFEIPPLSVLQKQLQAVATKEGKTLSNEGALLLAKHGKGSFRDALGYLEQVLTLSEDAAIEIEEVRMIFGHAEESHMIQLIQAFSEGDKQVVIDKVCSLTETSKKKILMYEHLLERVRMILLARITGKGDEETIALANRYGTVINSALVLYLLDKMPLVSASEETACIAIEAILINHIDSRS
jgi:DNA polymerase III subunit gamma/tau